MPRQVLIGVMGPGESATAEDCQVAHQVGAAIAKLGFTLLTGGRSEGVMNAASKGAKSENGLTVGILPGIDPATTSKYVDIQVLTGMGQARNAINVLSSEVLVAIGEGPGTFSEIALALKMKKPVIAYHLSPESTKSFAGIAGSTFTSRDQCNLTEFEQLIMQYVNNQ